MPPRPKPKRAPTTDIYATGRARPPTDRLTVISAQQETASIANSLTADRMVTIIRAAEAGNCTDLFRVYLDMLYGCAHLQGEFAKRKLNIVGEPIVIQPADKKNPADVAAADYCRALLSGQTNWLDICIHLLDSELYPVALAEKIYRPAPRGYELAQLVPVPHRLLDFRTGTLRVFDVDSAGLVLGTSHEPDPARYILHRGHLLTGPDQFGGPMRSLLWWWLLSTMDRTWWARFLERFGAPFLLGKYNDNDDASRSVLESAFALATRLGGLVVTKDTEVDIKEAAASSTGDAYERFITLCHREMSKLIVGQTLSAEAQSTGLGSGVAKGQEGVREDLRKWGALRLGETIRQQLLRPALAFAGLPGNPPMVNWGGITPDETKALADLLGSLKTGGLELTDDGVADVSGRINLPLQRATQAPNPFQSLTALAANVPTSITAATTAGDQIAANASAGLSRNLRARYADLPRLIAASTSPADLEAKIRAHLADAPPLQIATALEQALTAYAANALT